MQNNKKAFTMIEFIVVIVLIIILGAIAFLVIGGWMRNSRDADRIAMMGNIKATLEMTSYVNNVYPWPDNNKSIYDTGSALLWKQGEFGETVLSNVQHEFNKIPKDPKTEQYLSYSVSWDQTKYQVKTELEGNNQLVAIQSKVYAQENDVIVRIIGNYNGYNIINTGGNYFMRKTYSMFVGDSVNKIDTNQNLNILQDTKPKNNTIILNVININDIMIGYPTQNQQNIVLDNIKNKFGLDDINQAKSILENAAGGK